MVEPTHFKHISQIGWFPQVGVKIDNVLKTRPVVCLMPSGGSSAFGLTSAGSCIRVVARRHLIGIHFGLDRNFGNKYLPICPSPTSTLIEFSKEKNAGNSNKPQFKQAHLAPWWETALGCQKLCPSVARIDASPRIASNLNMKAVWKTHLKA